MSFLNSGHERQRGNGGAITKAQVKDSLGNDAVLPLVPSLLFGLSPLAVGRRGHARHRAGQVVRVVVSMGSGLGDGLTKEKALLLRIGG